MKNIHISFFPLILLLAFVNVIPKSSVKSNSTLNRGHHHSQILRVTLNNISETKFNIKIQEFCSDILGKVKPRARLSYYFKREVLAEIVDLLKKERSGLPENTKGTPDGIRIFFLPNKSKPRYFKLGIVATRDNGPDSGIVNGRRHEDYFEHEPHPLFQMDGTSGEMNEGLCRGGASLYQRCRSKTTCNDENCGIDNVHRLSRKYGEDLVASSGSAVINTKAVWFDFHTLEKIVNNNSLHFTGIRLYFGRYANKAPDSLDLPADHRFRDTFILMTTRDRIPTTGRDRTPVHVDQFKCDGTKKLWSSLAVVAAFNKGELCPSRCN